jgi:DNA-binding NarL/FixJ family response regulator
LSNLVLLVEDVIFQLRSLRDELTEASWEVLHAKDEEDALFRLRTLQEEGKRIEVAAIDLGLPPAKDDPLKYGIQLIAKLRAQKNYEDLPILAYTALTTFDYAAVVRRLLNFRASFICLRPMGEDVRFVDIIEYVRKGYLFLSPTPASYLPSAVLARADPLDDKLWETLSKLSEGFTHTQAAEAKNLATDTIKTRVERAKVILVMRNELPVDVRTDELLAWYREHRVRYGRD